MDYYETYCGMLRSPGIRCGTGFYNPYIKICTDISATEWYVASNRQCNYTRFSRFSSSFILCYYYYYYYYYYGRLVGLVVSMSDYLS